MTEGFVYLGSDGLLYRVHDCTPVDGRTVVADPPSPQATMRLFQSTQGLRRLYRFTDTETREPTDMALHRQFAASETLPDAPSPPGAEPGR